MITFRNLILFVLTVVTTAIAAGCDGGADATDAAKQQREAVPVTLAPVRIETLPRTVEVFGTLHGDEEATISAKVPGRIQKILADVGDRVAPGVALAKIDPVDYQLAGQQRELALSEALAKLGLDELPDESFDVSTVATVQRARSQAANAKAKLARARQLHDQQPPLMSDQDFADIETADLVAQRNADVALLEARAQLALARTRHSELQSARQRLADTIIRAPGAAPASAPTTTAFVLEFAVTQRAKSEGEYVREGDALFRLVADDPVKFRAPVAERFIAEFHPEQPVHVRVEGYDRSFTGKVSRINPAVNPQSRTFEIEVLIPNPERLLRPGAFVRGEAVIGQTPDVPFVPRSAVVSFAGVDRVFSVSDGKAVEHVVRLGPARDDHVAIVDGLANVDGVVVSGNQRLSRDVPVTVQAGEPVEDASAGQ